MWRRNRDVGRGGIRGGRKDHRPHDHIGVCPHPDLLRAFHIPDRLGCALDGDPARHLSLRASPERDGLSLRRPDHERHRFGRRALLP